MKLTNLTGIALAMSALAGGAVAGTLGPSFNPVYHGSLSANGTGNTFLTAPGSIQKVNSSTKLTGAPAALIDIQGFVDAGNQSFGGTGSIDYYFQFTGPSGAVPLSVDARLFDDAPNSTFNSEARLNIENVDFICIGTISGGCSFPPGSFTGTKHYSITANAIYKVTLSAYLQGNRNVGDASGHVYADPFFYLDPTFANAGLYQLDLSAGIGNAVAGTPEPGTLAICFSGLAGVGLLARRKKGRFLSAQADSEATAP